MSCSYGQITLHPSYGKGITFHWPLAADRKCLCWQSAMILFVLYCYRMKLCVACLCRSTGRCLRKLLTVTSSLSLRGAHSWRRTGSSTLYTNDTTSVRHVHCIWLWPYQMYLHVVHTLLREDHLACEEPRGLLYSCSCRLVLSLAFFTTAPVG